MNIVRAGKKRQMAEINVVPYIDVMLVLLVIFMITAPLLSQGVKVDLPKAKAEAIATKAPSPIVVTVNAQGIYFLNIAPKPETPIAASDLQNLVHQALTQSTTEEKRPVLVKADQAVNYGKVVQAMALLQQAGAPSVGLVTEEANTKPENPQKSGAWVAG